MQRTFELSEKMQQYRPLTNDGSPNCLSPALIALSQLHRPEEKLQQLYTRCVGKLLPRNSGASAQNETNKPMVAKNWHTFRGQNESFEAFLAYFTGCLQNQGTPAIFRSHWKDLIPGIVTDAFHPLIRLAYASLENQATEMAYALAYFSSNYLPMRKAHPGEPESDDPRDLLIKLFKMAEWQQMVIPDNSLSLRIRTIARDEAFAEMLPKLKISPDALKRMSQTMLATYIHSGDLIILHGILASHALRMLLPLIPDITTTLVQFWQALVTAYVSARCPYPGSLPDIDLAQWKDQVPAWEDLILLAESGEEPLAILVVHTCFAESRFYQNPLYGVAAAIHLKLFSPQPPQ